MKEFLYLFIGGETSEPAVSPEEQRRRRERWFAWVGRMHEAGVYRGGSPLEPGGRTIEGSDRLVREGPVTGAHDAVSGYVLVRVRDIDEAVAHARGCPIYDDGGRVEIRPVTPR